MPDVATGGPLGEFDLYNMLRLHPVRIPSEPARRTRIEGRLSHGDRLQLLPQIATECGAPTAPGSHLSGETKLVTLVVPDQHRPNAHTRSTRVREPADDELLPLGAFALLPVGVTRAEPVRGVTAFADDSLGAKRARLAQ